MPEIINIETPWPIEPEGPVNMYFVIDASSNMVGEKIAQMNASMRNIIDSIKKFPLFGYKQEFKINILKFSTGCEWIMLDNNNLSLEQIEWRDIEAGGLTDMGAALSEISNKIQDDSAKCIFLISGGSPTDNYAEILDEIKNKIGSKHITKYALTVEKECDVELLNPIFQHIRCAEETCDIQNMLANMVIDFISSNGISENVCNDIFYGEELYKNCKVKECLACGCSDTMGDYCPRCGHKVDILDSYIAYNVFSHIKKSFSYNCECGYNWNEKVVNPEFISFCPKCGKKLEGNYYSQADHDTDFGDWSIPVK